MQGQRVSWRKPGGGKAAWIEMELLGGYVQGTCRRHLVSMEVSVSQDFRPESS